MIADESTGTGPGHEALLAELLDSIPFLRHLGARLVHCDSGRAVLEMELQPHHRNSWGVAHGGLLMTLLDSAMGLAAQQPSRPSPGMATVHMSSQFIQAATGRLVVSAQVVSQSLAMTFCEASVADAGGTICARGMAAFKRLSMATLQPTV